MKKIIRFQDDYPVSVRFSFDSPLPKMGKYGLQYFYGVTNDVGSDSGFYATEKLYNVLQALGGLSGRRLEITKKSTDKGKNYWIISENGYDITPGENDIKNLEKKGQIEEEVDSLKCRVDDLERIIRKLGY